MGVHIVLQGDWCGGVATGISWEWVCTLCRKGVLVWRCGYWHELGMGVHIVLQGGLVWRCGYWHELGIGVHIVPQGRIDVAVWLLA